MSATGQTGDAGRPAPTAESSPNDTHHLMENDTVHESKGLPDIPETQETSINKVPQLVAYHFFQIS
jgi:hypothetical protein